MNKIFLFIHLPKDHLALNLFLKSVFPLLAIKEKKGKSGKLFSLYIVE